MQYKGCEAIEQRQKEKRKKDRKISSHLYFRHTHKSLKSFFLVFFLFCFSHHLGMSEGGQ